MENTLTDLLFEQYAVITKALGSPQRIKILEMLAQHSCSVSELASMCRLSHANTSQHLQLLKRAHLIGFENKGLQTIYHLHDEKIIDLLQLIKTLTNQVSAEFAQTRLRHFDSIDASKPISMVKLVKKMRKHNVIICDARSKKEFEFAHIAGAIHESQIDEYVEPGNQELVVYGRSELCALAYNVVARFNALGYKTRKLEGGFPEWKRADYPIE